MATQSGNPLYTVYIISGSLKIDVTPALISVDRSEPEGQMAQRATILLRNVLVNGAWLTSLLTPRNRVFIYADDGGNSDEVFRGYLWRRNYKSSLNEQEIEYTCYDNLIYFQESEDSLYFSSGKSTEDICASICNTWGVKMQYDYSSITHTKLPLRGKLSDIFTADLLDLVKKRNGTKYVILSDKDTMHIKTVGSNSTVYHFVAGKNVSGIYSGWTMEGMITKVVIVGKADDNERRPIEATVSGDTDQYGTLQKIVERGENTSLADAKLEAQTTIDKEGKPTWEYQLTAPDIPWIRKGDKVYVNAGDIANRYLIVKETDRTADKKTRKMTLTLEDL